MINIFCCEKIKCVLFKITNCNEEWIKESKLKHSNR